VSALVADPTLNAVAEAAGIAVLAGGLSAGGALLYRWYLHERVPPQLAALIGLAVVAVYLNTTTALGRAVGSSALFDTRTVAFNGGTFLASLVTTTVGLRIGDRLGQQVFAATGRRTVDTDVSRVVQAVGRVITVEMPDDVEDIPGYDPVPEATKDAIADRQFLFPRGLTLDQLHDRLVTRLKSDYGVGYVDIDLADDGSVEYLALGNRVAGIGPTLPPETAAVAVRADPAHAASAGDLVQVWRTDPVERVLTAEVRATADDVVTLAVDMADALALDDRTTYRLVTLPVETRPDREFASLLRAADDTMNTVSVATDSVFEGQPVGSIKVPVLAIKDGAGAVVALPADDRVLLAGETLYLLGRPEQLRRVEAALSTAAASATVDTAHDGAVAERSGSAAFGPDTSDATTETDAESGDATESPASGTTDDDAPGGGSTFADHKSEFESASAAWADPNADDTAKSDAGAAPDDESGDDRETPADGSEDDPQGDGTDDDE